MPQKISAVINTKNAADTLQSTLKSVRWADEIVVVDMKSSDETVKIAKKFTKQVSQYDGEAQYVEPARNFALDKASGDWILLIDADEVVPTTLHKKIQMIIEQDPDVACYFIPRKNIIFGKWIEKTGWWPDFQPRLFRKGKVLWRDEIHSQPEIGGQIEYLPATSDLAIEHHNYQSVSDYLSRLDRYTTIEADKLPDEHITPTKLMASFRVELMRRLFAENGIEEDVHGVALSYLQSMYQMVVLLKQWEQQGSHSSNQTQQQLTDEIDHLKKDLSYWQASYQQKQSTGVTAAWWRVRKIFKV